MATRAIIGLDLGGSCRPAFGLLRRMGFEGLEVTVVNSVEPILSDGTFPELGATHPMADILTEMRVAGQKAADEAAAELQAEGVPTKALVGFGDPVGVLRNTAEGQQADLIALGFENDEPLVALLGGSVSRGLAMSAGCSLLVAKHEPSHDGPLRALLATDHSEYSGRCVEGLIQNPPKGLGHVTVLSVVRGTGGSLPGLTSEAVMRVADAVGSLRRQTEERCAALAERLRGSFGTVDWAVVEGHANVEIRRYADAEGVDLVIAGAQGHGFLQRLLVGSVAFDLVERAKQNVYLLRP